GSPSAGYRSTAATTTPSASGATFSSPPARPRRPQALPGCAAWTWPARTCCATCCRNSSTRSPRPAAPSCSCSTITTWSAAARCPALVAASLPPPPPPLPLIIVPGAAPPLPVSRLRVRGQLAEVRAEQLRFSMEEAREFFDGRLDAALPERDVHRLLTRTEGWAAGLQLAALRLRGRTHPAGFICRYTGVDR